MSEDYIYSKAKDVLQKLWPAPTTKKIYEARWVWYHTILAFELLIIIIIQLLILAKI